MGARPPPPVRFRLITRARVASGAASAYVRLFMLASTRLLAQRRAGTSVRLYLRHVLKWVGMSCARRICSKGPLLRCMTSRTPPVLRDVLLDQERGPCLFSCGRDLQEGRARRRSEISVSQMWGGCVQEERIDDSSAPRAK